MSDGTILTPGCRMGEGRPGHQAAPDPSLPPRRGFLKALGLGAGAVGLAGLDRAAWAQMPRVNDPAILNFALNLEYLEAEFYTYALTGAGIEAQGIPVTGMNTGAGNPGPVIIKANPRVPFADPAVRQYAAELAIDEQKHVIFIRDVLTSLGVQPVARPAIDLLNSFNVLAAAAGLPTPFDPFANDVNFLLGSYIFEDVGVTAYRGAAPLIRNKAVLAGAAGILAVEALHAGLIRSVLYQQDQGPATDAISAVRRALGDSVDYGVDNGPLALGPEGDASAMLGNANAMAPSRTTRQVLNIVYGAVNAARGGFFPAGLNGPIR